MSAQTPYNAISQGPASIPMSNYGDGQRIMPPQVGWCTPRRTKVIIAIVLLSLIYIIGVIVYVVVIKHVYDDTQKHLDELLNRIPNDRY